VSASIYEIFRHTRKIGYFAVAVGICVVEAAWSTPSAVANPVLYPTHTLFDVALNLPFMLTDILIRKPLDTLYMHGPSLSGWGFWEGKRVEDICAEITNVPAATWELMRLECESMVQRRFQSFYVGVAFIMYALLAYHAVCYVWFRYTVMNPILHNVRMILRDAEPHHKIK
jgi:hypothetical protein